MARTGKSSRATKFGRRVPPWTTAGMIPDAAAEVRTVPVPPVVRPTPNGVVLVVAVQAYYLADVLVRGADRTNLTSPTAFVWLVAGKLLDRVIRP